MERLINFNTVVSLKQIALVKVSGDFWNREILQKLGIWNLDGNFNSWNNVTLKIAGKKVPSLPLPESVKVELFKFIKLMTISIRYWWNEVKNHVSVLEFCFHTICWTQQGLINKQKTVELLLEDLQDTLEVTKQFNLARIFCLEDRVWTLFKKLNNSQIESLEEVFNYYEDEWKILWRRATSLEEDISLIERPCPLDSYCETFQDAASNTYNVVGVSHFLKKLTPAEVESHLVETVIKMAKVSFFGPPNHVVCFLFSHMNRIQQLETLAREPAAMLKCFLYCPWQKYAMNLANCMWDFVTGNLFHYILHFISNSVLKTDDCQDLFKEFWLQSCPGHKEYIINDDSRLYNLLFKLISSEDLQNANVILDTITADRKLDMISSRCGIRMCLNLFRRGQYEGFKFLLTKCIPSKQRLLQFREELGGFNTRKRCQILDEVLKKKFKTDV